LYGEIAASKWSTTSIPGDSVFSTEAWWNAAVSARARHTVRFDCIELMLDDPERGTAASPVTPDKHEAPQ
jgi:hypothetical protein